MNTYLSQLVSIALPNKYTKWYIMLCESRLSHPTVSEYIERHHIVPKCFNVGGERDKLNIVAFTAREHFVAHWLLTKMFDHPRKIAQMCKAMAKFFQSNQGQHRTLTSVEYEVLRKKSALANIIIHTGASRSIATKLKMSQNNKASLESTKQSIRSTKLAVHGSETYNNRDKSRSVCLERYGVPNAAMTTEVQDKMKQTRLDRYGNENYNNSEKQKQTNLEKYGASVGVNAKYTCPYCNRETTVGWFNRKHAAKQCQT